MHQRGLRALPESATRLRQEREARSEELVAAVAMGVVEFERRACG